MVEWIQGHECLYNTKLNVYKDKQKKDKLWNDKAEQMGTTSQTLQVWYRSLRTRYGRLQKSGQGATEMTKRDEWVLGQFSFLKTHIYEVQRRTVVSVSTK